MRLIVGLGNPEERFAGTRHNLGFLVLDEYRRKHNLGDWDVEKKFKAEVIKVSPDLMLIRPQTYMNNSGMAVSLVANFFKIKPEDIIIVHDELDLLLGKIKIRLGGGVAGHHGVESVMEKLGTDQFMRVRLGIGNTQGFLGEHKINSFKAEKFVVEPFISSETAKVKTMLKQAIKALELLLEKGLEKAQNQFN